MVYTPCKYLVPAAIALVASQMQQAAGYSMFYAPETTSGTTEQISTSFPAYGAEVTDQDCAVTVVVDPTLPDITTISTVPVQFTDLLANTTTAPTEPVSTKVGTPVLQETTPVVDADQDTYTTEGPATQGPTTQTSTTTSAPAPATKTGVPPATTPTEVQGEADAKPKDCATGWEETKPARKLRDSAVSGHELNEEQRRLEANTNKDISKLEAYFGTKMETTLKDLPTTGVHTPSPWPGPYWPTYQDSINVVWSQGQPSPAEKYATAFGLDVEDFKNKVSKDNGIDSQSKRPKCTTDADCASLNNNSGCGIREGQSSGYCIPTWFGICHAWAPAAILEKEPTCPVTHNGVTFQPMDLKALISNIYDGAGVGTVFTGARYNGGDDSADEYGRHKNAAYRDLNPGYFHIATANLLGKLNATFVADVDAAAEVWNQPVRGFKVYEQTEMSLEEAAQTFYGLEEYPWNAAAKSIVYVKTRLSWIFETYTDGGLVSSGEVDKFTTGAYYYYLLELDDAGKIIGGEWVYNSDSNHVDFLWVPKAKPAANTVTSIGLSYADVTMLLEKSVACEDSSSSGSTSGSVGSSTSGSTSASTTSSTSGSTSASMTASTSASNAASTSGSSSVTGSTSEVSSSSTAGSHADGNVSTPTETPAATYTNTGSPDVSTEAPASTTATPSENNNGNSEEEDGEHHQQYQQQEQTQRRYTSFFHWG